MSLSDLVEKALVSGVSSLVAGGLGYLLAGATLKKSLQEKIDAAKEAQKLAVDAAIKAQSDKMEKDLKSTHDALAKNLHDAKGEFTRSITRLDRDLQEVEKDVRDVVKQDDLKSFEQEQTSRWNEVQRSLGFIEGFLKTGRRT